jgi:hypothetical protein
MHQKKLETFIITTSYTNYTLSILTVYDDETKKDIRYNVSIGGKKKGCVNILVNGKHGILGLNKFAELSFIQYDKRCNMNASLETGKGTKHMLKTALSIVFKLYPWIDGITLVDVSGKMCNPKGHEISLSRMSIALHGKTWYERHFNARLGNENLRKIYKNRLKFLTVKSSKPKTYTEFSGFFSIKGNNEVAKAIYETSDTFRSFFKTLKSHMTESELCEYMFPWITEFIDAILDENINRFFTAAWLIRKDDIEVVEFSKTEISQEQYDRDSFNIEHSGGSYFMNSKRQLHILEICR